MSKRRIVTDGEQGQAVKESVSYSGVLRKLGKNCRSGGQMSWVKRRIAEAGIDISHFTGVPEYSTIQYKTKDMFAEGSTTPRHTVREHILRHNLIPYKCAECGRGPEWRGKTMALELDHINGVFNDHRLENLRFLCPNCHAITDTYCGRNIDKKPKKEKLKPKRVYQLPKVSKKPNEHKSQKPSKHKYYCERCGKEIATHSRYCVECWHILDRKTERPDAITLAKMLLDTSFLQVGKSYGVSDNAVRKWCKQYDMPTKKPELKEWLTQHQSDS